MLMPAPAVEQCRYCGSAGFHLELVDEGVPEIFNICGACLLFALMVFEARVESFPTSVGLSS